MYVVTIYPFAPSVTRACSRAKRTAVKGHTGGESLSVNGIYSNPCSK